MTLVKYKGTNGTWREVADAANNTVGREEGTQEPSSKWKRRMLLAEHSPIRQLQIKWKWTDLPYWVSVHFVRHKIGIEHWVRSQRPDRLTGQHTDRTHEPQGALISHECQANPQSIINISRKRLCNMAMLETREAWKLFLERVKEDQPELYSACVRDCVYRGWCYEFKSCGFHLTPEYLVELEQYREGMNGYKPCECGKSTSCGC